MAGESAIWRSVRRLFGHGKAEGEAQDRPVSGLPREKPAPEAPPVANPPAPAPPIDAVADTDETQPGAPPTPEAVLDAMHDVIDPELGYNIVDIGLIYDTRVSDAKVRITMTMTTPGCPAQDYIMRGVYDRGMRIPGVNDMDVELTWNPPWSPQMMTPVAKKHFRIPDDAA
jgi:metal-sulfur cluster biosynthetic enzyme